MVDFEWYRSFVAIYQSGTVSAAAVRRSMTQPGISQHLAALERALGIRLFQRTPRQMVPTAQGQQLYTQIISAVEQLDRLSDPTLLRAETHPLKLRIGVPREFFFADGLSCLADVNTIEYQIQVVLGETNKLIQQVEAGELDIMIATQRITRRTIHYLPLQTEQFVLVMPPSLLMPEGLKQDQFVEWLEAQPWIAYAPDLPIIRRYWQDVFERRPNIVPRLIVPDLLIVLRAVTLGIGVSILPEYLCREAVKQGHIHIAWNTPDAPANQLYIACLRERLHEKEIAWFIETIRSEKAI